MDVELNELLEIHSCYETPAPRAAFWEGFDSTCSGENPYEQHTPESMERGFWLDKQGKNE